MPGIVVFAYSEVGHACLDELLVRGHDVRLVATHADDPGENKWFRSVADRAKQAGIETTTLEAKDGPWLENRIAQIAPDLILSAYYRRMIPTRILAHAKRGAVNMHGSLLPKYRGRAPANWAILNGETRIGVTLHHMVKRADAGDMVDWEAVDIGPEETTADVTVKCVAAARVVLGRQIDALLAGTAPRIPQDESQATYFGGRKPEDGRIDWTGPAQRVVNLVRAVAEPYPGAFADAADGRRLFVWRARAVAGSGAPGTVLASDPPTVAAGEGAVVLLRWQWAGEAKREAGPLGLATGARLG
ncbi:MAG: formyltransferase [Azospirillum sp.]|nr:formyltransferase [Azospirillum sp.]